MMKLIPVKVISHSGYKADEYPECFFYEGERFEVEKITDRWYQGDLNPAIPVSDYFKIVVKDGREFILKHETGVDTWHLCI